jgi:hypothetical protein
MGNNLRHFLDREWLPLTLIAVWVIFWLCTYAATFQ